MLSMGFYGKLQVSGAAALSLWPEAIANGCAAMKEKQQSRESAAAHEECKTSLLT